MDYGREGEERLFGAVAMWLRKKIEEELPEKHRGIYAPRINMDRLRYDAEEGLRGLAVRLALALARQISTPPDRMVPADLDGRRSTMDNELPCSECGLTTPDSIVVWSMGVRTSIECRDCAPELAEDGP